MYEPGQELLRCGVQALLQRHIVYARVPNSSVNLCVKKGGAIPRVIACESNSFFWQASPASSDIPGMAFVRRCWESFG
jgi:hypothetical protein